MHVLHPVITHTTDYLQQLDRLHILVGVQFSETRLKWIFNGYHQVQFYLPQTICSVRNNIIKENRRRFRKYAQLNLKSSIFFYRKNVLYYVTVFENRSEFNSNTKTGKYWIKFLFSIYVHEIVAWMYDRTIWWKFSIMHWYWSVPRFEKVLRFAKTKWVLYNISFS